jgi:hypothetical protein
MSVQTISAKIISLLAVLATSWVVVIIAIGGIDLRGLGVPFASTDPLRPAVVAAALVFLYVWRFRTQDRFHLARSLAVMLTVLVLGISLKFGSFVASAADPYGYISQSDLWLRGHLTIEQPIALRVPWSDADWTFSPLGYRPSLSHGAIVPTYAPGTPLLMAASKATLGAFGPYLVTPILGAATIFLTYALGARVWSPLVGLAAASWLAASPSFLYMLMWPMSDVPVSAFVTAAVIAAISDFRRRAVCAGFLSGLVILIRPNLIQLLIILGVLVVFLQECSWRDRLKTAAWFAAGAAPCVMAIAVINTRLYGAPWQSGYGSLQDIYRWQQFVSNLSRYPKWFVESQTPFVLFLIVPFLRWRRLPRERRVALVALATVACAIWLSYMFYQAYEEWWYLRFMLPALPIVLILAAIGCQLTLARVDARYRWIILCVIVASIASMQISYAIGKTVHRLCSNESAHVSVGDYVRRNLPPNAVILSLQYSGSVRMYGQRLTMRFDTLSPDWWPRAADVLTSLGLRPYVVLADFEEATFRRKFQLSDAEDAPGSVIAEIATPARVKIYDPLRVETRRYAINNLERRICVR